MTDLFCAQCQHSHSDQQGKALPFSHGSEDLESLTLCPSQQYTLTWRLTHSRLLLPTTAITYPSSISILCLPLISIHIHVYHLPISLYHLFFTIVYTCPVWVYAYNLSSSIYKYLPFIYQALISIKGIYLCSSLMYIECYLCCDTHVIVSGVPGSTVTLF